MCVRRCEVWGLQRWRISPLRNPPPPPGVTCTRVYILTMHLGPGPTPSPFIHASGRAWGAQVFGQEVHPYQNPTTPSVCRNRASCEPQRRTTSNAFPPRSTPAVERGDANDPARLAHILPQGVFRMIKTQAGGGGGSPKTPSPPPQTKVTIVGRNETYNWENLVEPFLVHKLLGPKPPLPPPPPVKRRPVLPPSLIGWKTSTGWRGRWSSCSRTALKWMGGPWQFWWSTTPPVR